MPEGDEVADLDLLPIDTPTFGPAFRMPVDEEPDAEEQIDNDLDPRAREDFLGLLYLGRLEEECTVAGHRFLLRTPSQDDRLDIGLVHKPYLNTVASEPAYRMITVASFVHRIDDQDEPAPLTGKSTTLRDRFNWIRASITSDVIIEKLFAECMELDGRTRAVVDYLDGQGKASG